MSCENVQERISLLLDCNLPAAEREFVLAHLDACGECGERFESMEYMRASLRDMARPRVPAALSTQLRVMASHECARRIVRKNLSTRLAHGVTATRLGFDNMMRPFAVPVTGGLLSAFVIFSLLVPSLSFRHNHSYEPPLAVAETDVQWGNPDGKLMGATADHARLLPGSALIDGNEVSLTLLIDERGRVQDFYLSGGELTYEMKNVIMFSQFTPATAGGQPAWGLKQVVWGRGHHLRS
jgi:hypothetical protein